jgi:nitrate reductase NapE component
MKPKWEYFFIGAFFLFPVLELSVAHLAGFGGDGRVKNGQNLSIS